MSHREVGSRPHPAPGLLFEAVALGPGTGLGVHQLPESLTPQPPWTASLLYAVFQAFPTHTEEGDLHSRLGREVLFASPFFRGTK